MVENVSGNLNLDNIQTLVQIAEGKAKLLKECCIWALWFCNHSNGVKIELREDSSTSLYIIGWSDEGLDAEAITRSYNPDDAAEFGAEAIALLISVERTEYDAVERSIKTTGIDYWLGFKNRHPNEPFHRASRLEISGIMKENKNNRVSTREKKKLTQTEPTDGTFPVYVIVVEFSQPYARMVLKK